jgi:3-dehydroquinate synthase
MTIITVPLGDRSYDIEIAPGLLGSTGEKLRALGQSRIVPIVTDANVAKYHLQTVKDAIGRAALEAHPIILPPGEGTKSWSMLAELIDQLLDLGIERNDHVVALGGGVIGDLVGFACAILKRGCNFVQIPTTLLAQVDSSVGGKTAINTAAGKNLVGAFHQPALVQIDPTTLDTLSRRDLGAGYAEIVKYGLIDDLGFFEWCEVHGRDLLNGTMDARIHAITTSVAAKAATVVADERETSGRRALLNLGHTFGHALEAETGFSDRLLHGEAVATGMALAFRYSARKCIASGQDAVRVTAHLKGLGLPTTLADAGVDASGKTLVDHMLHDKKMSGGRLPFI